MAARRRPPNNPDAEAPASMRPVCRNVTVDGRRTSVRMEPVMWDSLADISRRESVTVNDIVGLIDRRRGNGGLTAALRIFLLHYYRTATPPLSGLAEEQAPFAGEGQWSEQFERAINAFER